MVSKYINIVAKIVGYAFAAACLGASFTLAYSLLAPVDVLKDWTLTTKEMTYNNGSEITVISRLTKVMDVRGRSERFLICGNQAYPINEAIASSGFGSRQTKLNMILPDNVPNLPKKCHIDIVVNYQIYGYRPFQEEQSTNEFTVVK